MRLSELAELTGARVDGATDDVEIVGAAGLDEAGEGHVTFLANPRYTPRVNTTRASAIYLSEEATTEKQIAILRVKDPYLAYTRALRVFNPDAELEPFIHPSAVIDPTARIAARVAIGACSVIGRNAFIGDDVHIHPNVTVYNDVTIGRGSVIHSGVAVRERTVIGERVIIHNNAVIGCDGFGYAKDEEKHWLKIPQTGRVVIEDDVEIGAATTIDRASVGESRIGRGSKIDNLVMIAHNVATGEHCLVVAQAGIAGSTKLGNFVTLAGQVGLAGHLKIGNKVTIAAQSGVMHDIPDNEKWFGYPAQPDRKMKRQILAVQQLPELLRRVAELEKKLKESGESSEPKKV